MSKPSRAGSVSRSRIAVVFLLLVTLGACSSAPRLSQRGWHTLNRWSLNGWLQDVATRDVDHVAVFDFDNTCIFGDVGEAVLQYQLDQLRFELSVRDMADLFPVQFNGIDIRNRVRDLWAELRPLRGDVRAAKQRPAHGDFHELVWEFFETSYASKNKNFGPGFAFRLLAKLLGGFTVAEVEALTRDALDVAMKENGLAPHREMIDLMQALGDAGVEPYIVSASVEWVVETAARKLGFPVGPDQVFGIRVEIEDRRLTTRTPKNYPVTYREGKVELINEYILDEINPPQLVLVAGDADTDYEMLTVEGLDIRLLVNRNKGGDIARLYCDPRVLLQGLDQNSGRFLESRESIPRDRKDVRNIPWSGEILTQQTTGLAAHRGASHAAPECTIPAFKLAFDEGADYVEGDFWLTKDNRIVCVHDADTKRVAPGQQVLSVKAATLEQLQQLDVGMAKGAQFKGTRIPTLEEVLDVIPEGKGVYIEIKDPDVVPHLREVLEKSGLKLEQRVVIIAFDPDVIQAVKTVLPEVKALWLYWWYLDKKNAGKLSNTVEEIIYVARAIGADGIDINNCKWVNAEFIRRVRKAGLEFHVYTINEMQDAIRYMALGVDTITTDSPQGLRKGIKDYFHRQEQKGTSDVNESLTVHDDGSWSFRGYRPRAEPKETP